MSKKNGSLRPYREVAPPGTPKWYAARKTGIGSSEAAAASGLSKWESPLDVYLRKVGKSPEFEGNLHTRIGKQIEPLILALFQEETGKVAVPGPPMLRSAEFPWGLATPDAFVEADELVECKWTGQNFGDAWGDSGSDEVPEEVILQCQQQMGVSGRKVVWVPVLIGGRDFRVFRVERNEDLIHWLLADKERELWDRVLEENPPAPMPDMKGAVAAVNALYGFQIDHVGLELSELSNKLAERWKGLKQSIKELGNEADGIRALLMYEMGTAEYGLLADGSAIRREYRKPVSYTVNKKENVELHERKVPKVLTLVEADQVKRIEEKENPCPQN